MSDRRIHGPFRLIRRLFWGGTIDPGILDVNPSIVVDSHVRNSILSEYGAEWKGGRLWIRHCYHSERNNVYKGYRGSRESSERLHISQS